jgi:8-oxo-dGTP pyrophosphatase MutT (NUDIX family)
VTLEPASSRQGFLVCVVFVIEREGGDVLLLKRSSLKDHAPGEWETGSGGILSGESPYVAVVREAKEETGLEVEVIGVIDAFHFYRGRERRETIGITFHCRVRDSAVTLSSEHDESKWVPVSALVEGPYPEWLRRAAMVIQGPAAV